MYLPIGHHPAAAQMTSQHSPFSYNIALQPLNWHCFMADLDGGDPEDRNGVFFIQSYSCRRSGVLFIIQGSESSAEDSYYTESSVLLKKW